MFGRVIARVLSFCFAHVIAADPAHQPATVCALLLFSAQDHSPSLESLAFFAFVCFCGCYFAADRAAPVRIPIPRDAAAVLQSFPGRIWNGSRLNVTSSLTNLSRLHLLVL